MKHGRVVEAYGQQEWYLNDRRHRTDGPAVIHADGTQAWYENGQRHRTDGPAVIHADGTQRWYVNDQLHRTDGPAIIYADGSQEWWVDGKDITQKVEKWMETHEIAYPFDDNARIQFILTFN